MNENGLVKKFTFEWEDDEWQWLKPNTGLDLFNLFLLHLPELLLTLSVFPRWCLIELAWFDLENVKTCQLVYSLFVFMRLFFFLLLFFFFFVRLFKNVIGHKLHRSEAKRREREREEFTSIIDIYVSETLVFYILNRNRLGFESLSLFIILIHLLDIRWSKPVFLTPNQTN